MVLNSPVKSAAAFAKERRLAHINANSVTTLYTLHVHCHQGMTLKKDMEPLYCATMLQKKDHQANKAKAITGLKRQADKMLMASNKKFAKIDVGSSVRVPISDVDRSKGDMRNIIAVVMDVTHKDLYKIGSSHGVLDTLFSRNQIQKCKENFITIEQVPDCSISLRSTNKRESSFGGQGFVKCNCKTKCVVRSNGKTSCTCRRMNVICNSKCHQSLSCNK